MDLLSFRPIFYTLLWLRIFLKAALICGPVIGLFWIYFLPALLLDEDLLDRIYDFLYVQIGSLLGWSLFFGFVSIYWGLVFGIYFCRRGLMFGLLPGVLTSALLDLLMNFGGYGFPISLTLVIISLLVINREPLPPNSPPIIERQYQRKSKIGIPVLKIIVTIIVVSLILLLAFIIYINVETEGKLFIRFIIVPLLKVLCSGLQMYFLRDIPPAYITYAMPTICVSNAIISIFERLFTNSIFDTEDYVSFTLSTLLASLVEMANHATYFYRASITRKFTKPFSRPASTNLSVSLSTAYSANSDEDHQMINTEEDEEAWMLRIRKMLIVQEIATEMMMILTVTFLLYFVNPIVGDDAIQTISTLENCIYLLLIQIALELVSDLFGLYWTISREKIELELKDVDLKDRWYWLWLVFMGWQCVQVVYWLF
eukprot:TRINITY_DN11193_c0_g1_i1.p1 TRINITY_DN11193_c0_g1~~TRINITY_DN11193_c0_g1_i1.p1  ORF type:complete len:427 (+),score=71.27 TRINITY_DN11193_c0_g1_i1:50-1330(+)